MIIYDSIDNSKFLSFSFNFTLKNLASRTCSEKGLENAQTASRRIQRSSKQSQ